MVQQYQLFDVTTQWRVGNDFSCPYRSVEHPAPLRNAPPCLVSLGETRKKHISLSSVL